MTDDKKRALEQTILQIEKEFGKGSIMKLNESHVAAVEVRQLCRIPQY